MLFQFVTWRVAIMRAAGAVIIGVFFAGALYLMQPPQPPAGSHLVPCGVVPDPACHDREDLVAQIRAADAASAQLGQARRANLLNYLISAFTMLAAGAAVWSAWAAQRSAQVQTQASRPYIQPVLDQHYDFPFAEVSPRLDREPTALYFFQNFGESVGFIEEFRDTLVFRPDGAEPTLADFVGPRGPSRVQRPVLGGARETDRVPASHRALTEAEWDAYLKGPKPRPRFYCLIEITYRDLFNGLTTERFCMKLMPGDEHAWARRGKWGPDEVNYHEYRSAGPSESA